MPAKPPAVAPPRVHAGRIVLLVAAAALSTVAGLQVYRFWRHLPEVQIRHLDPEAYRQALREANEQMSADARQGLIAANVSSLFTAALRDPGVYDQNRDTVQQMIGQLRTTQLGRLQLAAFLMLDLERAGTPVEEWWPTLQPVLSGLKQASFAHFLPELIAHRASVFESLGLGPGSAWVEAERTVGHPHGPFVQYFVERLERIERAAGENSADSAQVCRSVVRRLLGQWVLDAGPMGVRLLAADLLADDLTGQPAHSGSATSRDLAKHLREWRATYHKAAAQLPQPVPMVMLGEAPPVPDFVYGQIRFLVVNTLRFAVRTMVAAVITIVCLIISYKTALTARVSAGLVVGAVAGCVVFVYAPLYLPGNGLDDLRRLSTEGLGWPRDVFVQALATVAFLALWAIKRAAAGAGMYGRAARLVFVGSVTCLVLSAFLAYMVWSTSGALNAYESQVAANSQRNKEYAVIAGADDTALMRELRKWDPGAADGR